MRPEAESEKALNVNGERLLLTTAGAVYWPAQSALLVADLHFEKGSSFARKGVLLPPYDTRTTLRRIAVLCRRYKPDLVISLGDAFHDGEAEARIEADDAALLHQLTTDHDWLWVLGNHDPHPPARFKGAVTIEKRLGGLTLRHEPADYIDAAGEVAGHLHPCARVSTGKGGKGLMRRRCFASDGRRLILPAFGAYTGGLNVLDEAYDGLFDGTSPAPFAWMLGEKGVYPFHRAKLRPDSRAVNSLQNFPAFAEKSHAKKRVGG